MRFVFVDRILALDAGRSIETLKNVSATEDFFTDHFPGHPIFPGSLIVEAFEQATQLLVGVTYAFGRVGRLEQLGHAAFRHLVRPGDQIRVRCERRDTAEASWTVAATARLGERVAASATLVFALDEVVAGADTEALGRRLKDLLNVLRLEPVEAATVVGRP